jgi:prevent-host-death family protein
MIKKYQNMSKENTMPLIRPISDLRNHANEISELCHGADEPVFITKNGQGDLVVMSHAHYERLHNLLELYQKLGEAEALDAAGDKGITHREMMKRIKRHIT